MTGKRLAIVSLLFLSFLAAPSHAATDEVRIIRGTLTQSVDITGQLSVDGTSGVRIDAALESRYASLAFHNQCGLVGCPAGDVVSIDAGYGTGVLTGSGQVTIHGQTYSLWSVDGADAQLQFSGAIVLPELTGSRTAEVSAPFAFSGFLEIPNPREPGTYDVFELRGSGVATALLAADRFNAGRWKVDAVTYEFAPRVVVTPQ
jgi:hypothetical protein